MKEGKINKLRFGMAAFGTNIMSNTISALLLTIYCATGAELVNKLLATTLLSVASIWDAIIDPFIGQISDNLRGKLGRRRPLMMMGAPVEAIALVFLLLPPVGASMTAILTYMIALRVVFFTFHSMVCVAYDSLVGEMARSSAQRVGLSTAKSIMAQAGVLVGTLTGSMLFVRNPLFFAAIIAVLGCASVYVTVFMVPKAIPESAGEKENVIQGILSSLKIKPFLIIFFSALVYISVQAGLMQNLYYMLTAVAELADAQAKSISLFILAGMVLLMMASALVWNRLAKNHKTTGLYRTCFLGLAISCAAAFFAGKIPGIPPVPQVVAALVLIAPFLAGALVFAFALMGNVVDFDEVISKKRREATFYGTFAIASGVGTAIGTQIIGLCHLLGDTAENSLGVRMVFAALAALALVILLLLRKMKLGDTLEETCALAGVEYSLKEEVNRTL